MPDVAARVLRSLAPALERAGCDLDSLLVAHGLLPSELWAHPGARIAWNSFADVLEETADVLGGPEAMDPVGAECLIWNWKTLIALLSRYVTPYAAFQFGVRFVGPAIFRGIHGLVDEIPGGLIETVSIPRDRRDSIEFFWLCRGVMRQFPTTIGWTATSVELTHLDHSAEFRILLSRSETGRANAVEWRNEANLDSDLEELASLGLASIDLGRPQNEQCENGMPLANRLRILLREMNRWLALPVSEAAQKLGMSERSLARWLALEGTTFRAIRDDVRREIAIAQLRRGVSIETVTDHLGFQDVTSFYRAFHRWTGSAPGAYRRERDSSSNGDDRPVSGA